jgi:hypothetical protein
MPAQKKTPAKPAKTSRTTVRKIKPPKYKTFRLSKRIKHLGPALPSASKIFRSSLRALRTNWRSFGGIALIYLVLSLILVRGLGSNNLPELKQFVEQTMAGQGGDLTVGFTVFGILLGSTSQVANQVGGVYQSILLVGVSLVVIWALRQAHAGTKFRIKEAFYKSFYPLIPFLLVVLVLGLQILPIVAANMLYNVIIVNGVATTAPEQFAWVALLALLVVWSLYMLTSSILSIYIVTLPDMQPIRALRSARELVRHRRWMVMRKVLFLPFILLLIGVLIMLPIIIFVAPIAEWVFVILSTVSLITVHSYLYSLYRELL